MNGTVVYHCWAGLAGVYLLPNFAFTARTAALGKGLLKLDDA